MLNILADIAKVCFHHTSVCRTLLTNIQLQNGELSFDRSKNAALPVCQLFYRFIDTIKIIKTEKLFQGK